MNRPFATPLNRHVWKSLLVLFAFGPVWQSAFIHAEGEPKFDVEVQHDVWVTMRDGIRLATDVYLPAVKGIVIPEKLPTILQRTPYDKRGKSDVAIGNYFASHGYVVVNQDTRGRFQSEGIWHMLTDDGNDGLDVCEWIGKQSWSNNRIGMIGTSYVGGTQHAAALRKPPNLTTVIPVDAMSNMGYQSMRNAGAFELRFWNWIFTRAAEGSRQVRDPKIKEILEEMAANRRHYLLNLPTRKGMTPLRFAPEYEEWLVEAMKHGGNDAFWAQNNIIDHPDHYKDIPVLLIGGWYDSWGGNTSANYKTLSRTIKGPVYLTMGPWIHGKQGMSWHGQVSFGDDAAIIDPLAWRLEWYDHWLKGTKNSVGHSAPFATPIRIFVMGTGDGKKTETGLLKHGGFWRDEQEWPLARAQYTNYYFQRGGVLSRELAPDNAASTSFTFDPANPVPTIGGNLSSAEGIMLQGAWNQRGGEHIWNGQEPIPLSARRDVLVFQSEPLADDVEVTGEIEVKLWASSSAIDTDFTAKFIDVYPSSPDFPGGFDLNLEDGIVRARYRNSLKEETLMQPGTIYPMTIKLYPTSNVFKKGHRIRVDLSSSNFPRFDVNPNTGEPLGDHRRTAVATNTVLHDRLHPSHIVLPIIPSTRSVPPKTP
jgi:putative CocE/NonD family hydrolase